MRELLLMQLDRTKNMEERISNASDEELSQFVDERQEFADLVQTIDFQSFSLEEREAYRLIWFEILEHEQIILAELQRRKENTLLNIGKMDNAKRQKNAYQTEYSMDSFYLDKKS